MPLDPSDYRPPVPGDCIERIRQTLPDTQLPEPESIEKLTKIAGFTRLSFV